MKRLRAIFFLGWIILCINTCFAQSYQQQLCNLFAGTSEPAPTGTGTFSFQQTYSPSLSSWQVDWSETLVFNNLMTYTLPTKPNLSYELRMGKGGQVYSFRNAGFGEALPPQWRNSYNTNGQNIGDQPISNPINSHHGNWAPWVDEVWQMVGSDQKDYLNGAVKAKNIHQGGSYMNNFTNRASDLTQSPFYSPMVQSHYDAANQAFTSIIWGQSENPPYLYNAPSDCDVCFPYDFRPSVLYFQRHKNIGNGVIQVDFLIYNFHREREIDFWNVPFLAVRNSSLPYAFISSTSTNDTSYIALNSLPGHPSSTNPTAYIPQFNQGVVRTTSGSGSQSSGWFAFSTTVLGNGPSLAFVTAKSSANPANAYGDIRYGTAMGNAIRDVTIFTRRAGGGSPNAQTGLKPWGIVDGQSIKGRYFIVLGDNLANVVQTIKNRNLVSYSSLEKVTIAENSANLLHFTFTPNPSGTYSAQQTTLASAYISLNSQPFTNSYPVFLISSHSASYLSTNPYALSLRPYDGAMQKIELLGFSSTSQNTQNLSNVNLPIQLNYFKGTKTEEGAALLEWATETEINNDYFALERSANDVDYQEVGRVKSAENSNNEQQYEYIDHNPIAGNNYYRLRQVDLNGAYSYSQVQTLHFDKDFSIHIFPNPFSDKFSVDICASSANEAVVKVFDMKGRLVQQSYPEIQVGDNHLAISGEGLAAGVYMVRVAIDGVTRATTIVKK